MMSSPSFLILSSLRLTVTLLRKVNATAIEKKEGREGIRDEGRREGEESARSLARRRARLTQIPFLLRRAGREWGRRQL